MLDSSADATIDGTRWIARWARFVVRHRRLVLAAVALVTAVLSAGIGRLQIEIDPDRQLPQDHPFVQALNDVHRIFGDKNLVVVGLFPRDGDVFTPGFLAKLASVTARLREVPGANPALVQSLASPQTKAIRGTAAGLSLERVLDTVPSDADAARAVRQRAFAGEIFAGTLISRDGRAAAVQASFELTPQTPGYRQLHRAILEALEPLRDETFDLTLSGPVVFLSRISEYTGRIARYFPLALLVIGLVHYHAFRTLQALLLPLLTALLSVAWALGLMGFAGVPLDPFNTTTPVLILAVAAGHAVQILKRFYEELEHRGDVEDAVVASLVRVGPVMIAAGLVAALSFCSLVTFQTATIRTFGLFTGFGILSALVVELTLIPAMRAALPAPRGHEREREASGHRLFDAFLRRAAAWSADPAAARRVLVGAGLLVTVCLVLATRIQVNLSLKQQFRSSDAVRIDDARINDAFSGTNTLILLVEGGADGALEDPAVLRALDTIERGLEQEAGVGKVLSYVDLVRQMHVAMNADDPVAGDLPATRALVAQYLFLYSMSGGGRDFDTILDPTHRIAKVRLLVHEDGTHRGLELIARARELAAGALPPGVTVRFTGSLASTAAATEVMVAGKLRNIVQIAAITLIVSSLLLRSLVGGLLVALPLALAVIVNFGAMGLFGVPLDSLTSAISAMAVGIGADYAMYFLFRTREEMARGDGVGAAVQRSLTTSGKAILFVSSAVALGYLTLGLSGFGMHVKLATLVALAMLVSSCGALILLPAIVVRFRPRFLLAGAPETLAAHDEAAAQAPAVAVEGLRRAGSR